MKTFTSFDPPRRTLLGPGPSDVPTRVLAAMARPCVGHLDPRFAAMMDEVKALLRFAFQTTNALTFPVSGPGSAGMEACFVNLVETGDEVIVCKNGVFGGRMAEVAARLGAVVHVVEDDFGKPVSLDKLDDALKTFPRAKLVAFVHAETSTGARSDAAAIAAHARAHGCLVLMDAVTSLGGIPVELDAWGIDAVYSGSQKCLSCTPGLSPVSFSPRALERVRARREKAKSWLHDVELVMGYWSGEGGRTYHHTAPVNALYGLHEALVILHEEGLDAAFARHRKHHEALAAGVSALGLSFLVDEDARLPQLNTLVLPAGVDEARRRARLLHDFGIEIGAGLGPLAGKVWRIGLMGASSSRKNVLSLLAALESLFERRGAVDAAIARLG